MGEYQLSKKEVKEIGEDVYKRTRGFFKKMRKFEDESQRRCITFDM